MNSFQISKYRICRQILKGSKLLDLDQKGPVIYFRVKRLKILSMNQSSMEKGGRLCLGDWINSHHYTGPH